MPMVYLPDFVYTTFREDFLLLIIIIFIWIGS